MHRPETRCHSLLVQTAEALNGNVITLILLAVQGRDLDLNITQATKR